MAKYKNIDGHGSDDRADSSNLVELIQSLADNGKPATLLHVQNGALRPCQGAKHTAFLVAVVQRKIESVADGSTLLERATGKAAGNAEVAGVARRRRMAVTLPALLYECCCP